MLLWNGTSSPAFVLVNITRQMTNGHSFAQLLKMQVYILSKNARVEIGAQKIYNNNNKKSI
jgi:hypothetical protein